MPPGQYPVPVPQQQMSPQLQPQMAPQMAPQMLPQLGPHIPGQMPQRRPMGYRMPMPGQPYGPGPGAPNHQQPGFSGSIQPRPLNSLVAQQPVRGQMQNRMPPGKIGCTTVALLLSPPFFSYFSNKCFFLESSCIWFTPECTSTPGNGSRIYARPEALWSCASGSGSWSHATNS